MYNPPAGFEDLLDDAESSDRDAGPFRELEVVGMGVFRARRTIPGSTGALAMSANAQIANDAKAGYLNLFLQNHLADGEYNRLVEGLIEGRFPEDAVVRLTRALATQGTARPT
jgi:hypothetical protein